MSIKERIFILFVLSVLAGACDHKNSESSTDNREGMTSHQDDANADQGMKNDSLFIGRDRFQSRLAAVTPLLSEWNFHKVKDTILNDRTEFDRHWWLKIFGKKQQGVPDPDGPSLDDWETLKEIRQVTFKKSWEFVIEDWQLADTTAARRWINIALDTRDLDNFKPPRVYWTEGNRMYFIMATAAADWSEHSDKLIEAFTGMNRSLIELFNRPVDLAEYKRKKAGVRGRIIGKIPWAYRPDTAGNYFEFRLFQKPGSKYPPEKLYDGLIIRTYRYGNDPGDHYAGNEELIEIESAVPDPDLGQLDLVGKDTGFLSRQFGMNIPSRKELILENLAGDLLIVHLPQEDSGIRKVDWFNFLRSTLPVQSADSLPDALKHF